MKKSMRILAVAMVAVMLCLCLASCGSTIKGKYESKLGALGLIRKTMEFDGKNVTVKYVVSDLEIATVSGTYTIDGDKITFDFVDESGVDHKDAREFLETLTGELSFEKGKDYVKIGGVEYTKVKK